MNSLEIFLNIALGKNKFAILVVEKKKIIFFKEQELLNHGKRIIHENFDEILRKSILEIEAKFRISLNKINLMIEQEILESVDATIKKNFENKKIDKKSVEYLIQDLRFQVIKSNPEKQFIHIIIRKCFVDDDEYNTVPIGENCKVFSVEICFIYIPKKFLEELEFFLKKNQLDIKRIISTNYAKSLLNKDTENLGSAAVAVTEDINLKEVNIFKKNRVKYGFFERIFRIFV